MPPNPASSIGTAGASPGALLPLDMKLPQNLSVMTKYATAMNPTSRNRPF